MLGERVIMRELAARPQGVTNGEFAQAAGITSENAGSRLSACIRSGTLFRGNRAGETRNSHYFNTQAAADACSGATGSTPPVQASHGVIAREAVGKFRSGEIHSSHQLADLCNCTVDTLDTALSPLVDAGKLVRVNTQRSGIDMYSYRYGATYVPKDDDFNFDHGRAAPKACVSPVAPPKAKAAPVAPPPSFKAPQPPSKPRADAVISGDVLTKGDMLGFAFQKAETAHQTAAVQPQRVNTPIAPENHEIVFAINSRGDFAMDLCDGGDVVELPAHQALQLKRFLDSTTVLECIAAQAGARHG